MKIFNFLSPCKAFAAGLLFSYWIISSSAAFSATVVDTGLGSGSDLVADNVWWVMPGDGIFAGQFSLPERTRITSAEGWFGISDTGFDFDILIYDQAANGLPGSALFSEYVFAPPQYPSGEFAEYVYDWFGLSNLDWELPAGTYWISFEGTNPPLPGLALMPGASQIPLIHYAEKNAHSGYEWAYADWLDLGVRIEGSPVPLPASIWLFLSGIASLSIIIRKKKQRN